MHRRSLRPASISSRGTRMASRSWMPSIVPHAGRGRCSAAFGFLSRRTEQEVTVTSTPKDCSKRSMCRPRKFQPAACPRTKVLGCDVEIRLYWNS
eukprot:6385358-Prymnesium_polylepis.2